MTFLISTFGPVVISWFFIAHRRIASGYFCLGAAVARRRPSDRPSLRSVVSIARGEAHESETDGRVAAAAVPTTRRTRLSARARPGLTGRPAGGSPWLGEPPTRADPPTHHRIHGDEEERGEKHRRSPATHPGHVVLLVAVVGVGVHVHTRPPEDRIRIELCVCARWTHGAGRQIVRLSEASSRSIAHGEAHESETGRREARDSPAERGLGSCQDRPAGGPVPTHRAAGRPTTK